MPGARWFPGVRLSYTEHALRRTGSDDAVVAVTEDGTARTVSWDELRAQVGAAQAGLQRLGVGEGDVVVAVLPNGLEALVAFLATAGLGAVWSSCSPDFGARSLVDRFGQVEPAVLVGTAGYAYGGRRFETLGTLQEVAAALPTLRAVVVVGAAPATMTSWDELLAEPAEPVFTRVAFDAPLWVLYSSGTTGLPKPIVQGQGGILLEHLKSHGLHSDLGPDDRFTWFTTTGWMMWNKLVSGLLVGATVVLYDGSPAYPDLGALWRMAEQQRITCFGTSAPFLDSCRAAGLVPREVADLSAVRTLGLDGGAAVAGGLRLGVRGREPGPAARLAVGRHRRVHGLRAVAPVAAGARRRDPDPQPRRGGGGVRPGRHSPSSTRSASWSSPGRCRRCRCASTATPTAAGCWRRTSPTTPASGGTATGPGSPPRAASSSTAARTPRSTAAASGSGTAEFYRVVEELPEVRDSLVVDTGGLGRAEDRLLLFLVLADGSTLDDALLGRLRSTIRTALSPRHVPDEVFAVPEVPRTLNGKKLEVPVKRLLTGTPFEKAVSLGAVANPDALEHFVALAQR